MDGRVRKPQNWANAIHFNTPIRFLAAILFRAALDTYAIANTFEIYPGTHTSKVAEWFQNHVVKCFRQNLCFQAPCK